MIRDAETLALLCDSVRRFVRDRLVPVERLVDESDEIPPELVQGIRELGLFGMTIVEDHGGLGLTAEEEMHVVFELTQTSPAFRSLLGTTVGIGSQGLVMDGTPEQKSEWLPRLASGELIAAFCLTEAEAGSDAASLRTRAALVKDGDGDHYVVNGSKRYITNAPLAGVFTLMARTDPDQPGAAGITAFIVDAKSPGITVAKPDRKMGHRGSQTCDVHFDGVRVPAANIIGGVPGRGFVTAMKTLDKGRLHIAAVCVGVATRILADALRYAMERRQFGQPIAEFQLVQAMLADSQTELYAARCMVIDVARRRDDGLPIVEQAACAKLFASEACGRIADRAVQIFGGAGYIADSGIERFYRDVRLFRIYEGTTQIQQLVIAKQMMRGFKRAQV